MRRSRIRSIGWVGSGLVLGGLCGALAGTLYWHISEEYFYNTIGFWLSVWGKLVDYQDALLVGLRNGSLIGLLLNIAALPHFQRVSHSLWLGLRLLLRLAVRLAFVSMGLGVVAALIAGLFPYTLGRMFPLLPDAYYDSFHYPRPGLIGNARYGFVAGSVGGWYIGAGLYWLSLWYSGRQGGRPFALKEVMRWGGLSVGLGGLWGALANTAYWWIHRGYFDVMFGNWEGATGGEASYITVLMVGLKTGGAIGLLLGFAAFYRFWNVEISMLRIFWRLMRIGIYLSVGSIGLGLLAVGLISFSEQWHNIIFPSYYGLIDDARSAFVSGSIIGWFLSTALCIVVLCWQRWNYQSTQASKGTFEADPL